MKTCPHCNKQFKLKKSLTNHMMLCQLDNKETINVLPTQKEMWIILQKLYKDNECTYLLSLELLIFLIHS